jgi:hypothetical protein
VRPSSAVHGERQCLPRQLIDPIRTFVDQDWLAFGQAAN